MEGSSSRAPTARSLAAMWTLVVVLPAIGCGVSWLRLSLVTTARDCATGDRASHAGTAVFVVLVALAPVGIALQARLARVRAAHACLAALIGTGVAVVAIFVTTSVWWSGHNCMT